MIEWHFYALSKLSYKALTLNVICSNRKNIYKKYSEGNFGDFYSKWNHKKSKKESPLVCGFFVRNHIDEHMDIVWMFDFVEALV